MVDETKSHRPNRSLSEACESMTRSIASNQTSTADPAPLFSDASPFLLVFVAPLICVEVLVGIGSVPM